MPAEPFVRKEFRDIVASLLGEVGGESGGRSALGDATAGSVVRTLMEAFARELALCYEQLEVVRRAGYLDTAEGQALDNVVALLGIERLRAGHLVGAVEFSRSNPADADIAIPAATLVAGRDVPPAATTRDATLVQGERVVRVDVQSLEPSPDGAPIAAGRLNLMPRPVAGIERVTNTLDLMQRQRPESDDELRIRARNAVRRAHTGTCASLEVAVRAQGVLQVRVSDLADDPTLPPATVSIVVGDADLGEGTLASVYAAVREVRPAGVRVLVNRATSVPVRVEAVLDLAREATPAEQQTLLARTRTSLASYVGQLGIGEMLRAGKVRAVLGDDDRIASVAADGPDLLGLPPHAASLRLSNGDVQVGPSQRIVLDTSVDAGDGTPWPKLRLRSPGLRIDAVLLLPAERELEKDRRRQEASDALIAAIDAIRREIEQAARPREGAATGTLPEIGYDRLWAAVASLGFASARFTVVHERNGRVAVLAGASDRDVLAAGEWPRAGTVSVEVAP